ncbi:MAG TPA: DEAD/DEAH box helicase [Candidatus Acidoferrales bacterium]|jgi:ATP-dependent Lhr-like helicase|nr:DEAD/DEAH box helicase [Candidatus Acidoferrales bacterium]
MNSPSLNWAHPVVQEWFTRRFGSATEPQEQGWPHILANKTTLISAPTGSGKTLAAFLACIDRLVRKAIAGELGDTTQVLYVSPLKALGNDIQKNLEQPLGEILQVAGEHGFLMPEIRTAVRSGDTLMKERRAMLKRPPHILVTTPESLYILLTARKSREILRSVETVIVDEIHAVADDKRGTHLALSLERLEALTDRPPVRIGLSATQKPIELVAHFLAGSGRPDPAIVQIGHQRAVDIAVEVPRSELAAVASHEMWDEIYDRLAELVEQHRSSLLFVNTRRLAERVAHHLAERLGAEAVATHHGSLSRKLRLEAERKLKAGEVKALVATASLELGIDIGSVDLVCQIGSPRSIAVAWQRIGRSGHWHGAVPKGRIFAMTRGELIECAALVRAMRQGELDRIRIPENSLDILAQQVVAACASEDWSEDDLFTLVRRAYSYRNLERTDFDSVIAMLSEGINARRGRYGAYLHRDRVNGRVHARRGSRLAAITSGGAIPDNALYTVVSEPEGAHVGTVDEDFAVESLRGDIMLLGNSSWRIRRVEAGRVLVEDAKSAPPNIPFWRGEAPARTRELSQQVAELRQKIADLTEGLAYLPPLRDFEAAGRAFRWLEDECGLDRSGAEQAVEYIVAGRSVLGAVPTQATIIAERFFDESGGMQLVIHAPFGGGINKAWGLALRKRFCRSFNLELQAAATDEGINIGLSDQHSFPLADVFRFLHPSSVGKVLEQAVLASPLFTTRWRWDASRALALLRFQGGRKVPPQIQRMRADDLLAAVFPDAAACQENIEGEMQIPDHPLIREVMKDALTEAMDLEGLTDLLPQILDGRVRCLAVDTPVPSQFSHEILNANPFAYLDDAPLEERRARAVEMRRVLPETVASDIGRLDPAAISEVRKDAWPDVRDAEELHDALETLIALPEPGEPEQFNSDIDGGKTSPEIDELERSVADSVSQWRRFFEDLASHGRAGRAQISGRNYWVAAERTKLVASIFPGIGFAASIAEIAQPAPSREEALSALLTGWLQHSGPIHAQVLAHLFHLPEPEISNSLLRIEATGTILRGHFAEIRSEGIEWCERRLLSRIHRLTIGKLRKEIEPVTASQFMRWLARWQHVAPGTLTLGERGLLDILRQLQGYEAPANAWESEILKRRVADYDPTSLDNLCLRGAVGWGRLSPHPAMLREHGEGGRRIVPSSIAPITFFVRDDADWMACRQRGSGLDDQRGLSRGAKDVLDLLASRGALFFADIVRGTRKLKSEVEADLWELVAAGMITADGFDNLRALIDPKRRAGQGRGRTVRPRDSGGRWSVLFTDRVDNRTPAIESTCWMLLRRYGIVFRELLAHESIQLPWREVLIALRRLEDRGEIRGGRFVNGFLGEQFALPVAADSLRASRSQPPTREAIRIAAVDPLNLVGIVLPGDRIPVNSGRSFALRDGVVAESEPSPIENLRNARVG